MALTKRKMDMFCSFGGIWVLYFTFGLFHYWGNLSVYTNSYFRRKLGPDPSINSPWVISLISIGRTITIGVGGYLAVYLGDRCTLVLGCLLLDAGVLLSALSINWSVVSLDLSIGLVTGLGLGLAVSMGLKNIILFNPKHLGMVVAFLVNANNLGGATFNQLITFYVNPDNLTPDLHVEGVTYFTQAEVLDKVPSVFLMMGVFNLGFHIVGILLFKTEKVSEVNGVNEVSKETSSLTAPAEKVKGAKAAETCPLHEPARGEGPGLSERKNDSIATETASDAEAEVNYDFKEMLRSKSFYVLWLLFFVCDYSYIVMNNYYKIYGLTRIPDDQFMANLATTQLIATMFVRPFWGFLVDKSGVKVALLCINCTLTVVCSFWYFTPMVNRWTYCFWTIMYASCNSGLYTVFPLATMRLFGRETFSKNYGFVISSCFVINIVAPPILQWLQNVLGWFSVFFSAACGNAVGAILCLVILPRK